MSSLCFYLLAEVVIELYLLAEVPVVIELFHLKKTLNVDKTSSQTVTYFKITSTHPKYFSDCCCSLFAIINSL